MNISISTPARNPAATRLTRALGAAAASLYTALAFFQVALATGAPWAEHAWGGAYTGELPVGLRVASGIAAAVLLGMAAVVAARAGVIGRLRQTPGLTRATWGIAGLMALNTIGNLASRSHTEQFLFSRATFVLAVLTAVVAYRASRTA